MTLVLVRKLLRDIRWPLLVVGLLLFLFSAFWVKICQRVTTEIAPFFNILGAAQGIGKEVFDEVIFKGPGKVSQAVMGGAEIQFDKPNDFLAVELLHPVVVILSSLWAVGRAAAAVSGELDRGTMELLLSQPVPRNRLILAHLLVDLLAIPLLCGCIVLGTQTGLALIGPFDVDYSVLQKLPKPVREAVKPGPPTLQVSAARQWLGTVNLAALMFALSGLTLLVSSLGRSRWRTMATAGLGVVGMFVANVVGQLWDAAAWVRPATAFFYYQPQKVWLKGDWTADGTDIPGAAVLLAVGVIGYLAALRAFTRRDLPAPL
jgi:ABC-2 type transport system permease protein